MRRLLPALCALIILALPAQASARDVFVTSFDGTQLYAHFYPSATGQKAPTVIIPALWSFPGDTNPTGTTSDVIGASNLIAAGYNVVTYDARGFNRSGGASMFDSPAFEGKDVQTLVSYIAAQPEAKLDAPGDPRVGMSGSEYGGGIQLVAAALDQRIDAIVPDQSWYTIPRAFFRDGAVKATFPVFCDVAFGRPVPPGTSVPPTPIATRLDNHIVNACNSAATTGTVSAGDTAWFEANGPGSSVDNVRAATLLLQGTVDAEFSPDQVIPTYDSLRRHNVPVKMYWYCGGHGPCRGGGKDMETVRKVALRWLNRWLKPNPLVNTGPRFEWIDDGGVARTAPDYPLGLIDSLSAAGFGHLAIKDQGRGTRPTFAIPQTDYVNATFSKTTQNVGIDIVGRPIVQLTYRGTATPANTYVYAQIIDGIYNRVVDNQVTPIPVTLDGVGHVVTVAMEAIAAHAYPSSIYRLQITPSSPVYTAQRSTGTIDEMTVDGVLPVVDATKTDRPAG